MKELNFLKDAKSALDNLLNKDPKYHQVIKPTLEQYHSMDTVFSTYQKMYEDATSYSQKRQTISYKNYVDEMKIKSAILEDEKRRLINESSLQKKNTKRAIDEEKRRLLLSLEDIEHQVNLELEKHQTRIAHFQHNKLRETTLVEHEIAQIKKNHIQNMRILEQDYQESLKAIDDAYQIIIPEKNDLLADKKTKINEKLGLIGKEKEQYRKQADDNYLSIKNVYHQSSTSFNQKIDILKTKRKQAAAELQELYKYNLSPIEDRLKTLQDNYQEIKTKAHQDLLEQLKEHTELLETITTSYNDHKDKITKETAEAITVFNSKLSAYKENVATERSNASKKLKESLKEKNESERLKLQKVYNHNVRLKDTELNRQIVRNQNDTLQRQREYYKRLLLLEQKFIHAKKNWRLRRNLLEFEYKQSLSNMELNYQHRLKEIDIDLKKEKLTLDYQTKLLDLNYLSEVEPLDTQLTIANSIQEREINLLTNDTSYFLADFQHQEQTLKYELDTFILNHEYEVNLINTKYQFDKNSLSMSAQLNSEKAIVSKDAELSKQTLRKDLIAKNHELNMKQSEYQNESSLLELSIKSSVSKEVFASFEKMSLETSAITESLLQTKQEVALLKHSYDDNVLKSSRNQLIQKEELNTNHARIILLFNQVLTLYHTHHQIFMKNIDFYKIPSHPEDFKSFVHSYINLSKQIESIQLEAFDEFSKDMTVYHEQKITDMTGYKLDANLATLKENHKTESTILDQKTLDIKTQIKHFENQIFIKHAQTDKTQTMINSLEKVLFVTTARKEKMKIKLQIQHLTKTLKSINKSIDTLSDEIDHQNDLLHIVDDKRKELDTVLEISADRLKQQQRKDAGIYFEQLTIYQMIANDGKKMIRDFYHQIHMHVQKLLQQLYLTDVYVVSFSKKITNIESSFEKLSLNVYHMLLNTSMRLYNFLESEQQEIRSNIESYHKKMVQDYKQHEALLTAQSKKASDIYQNVFNDREYRLTALITQQTAQLNHDKQPLLDQLKKQIAAIENDLHTMELHAQNEITLIQTNLKNVLTEYHNDFEKNNLNHLVNYKKTAQKVDLTYQNAQSQLEQLKSSTQMKNDNILEKYDLNYKRILDLLKEKQRTMELNLQNEHHSFQDKLNQLNLDLERSKKELILSQKNLAKQAKLTIAELTKIESKTALKELKDAQKSYRFKRKTLKI